MNLDCNDKPFEQIPVCTLMYRHEDGSDCIKHPDSCIICYRKSEYEPRQKDARTERKVS